MLRCVKCGEAGTGRFCGACGGQMGPACAKCGAGLAPAARFCSGCGQPVPPPPAEARAGSGFTMGDIGVMRGVIDLSNTTHNTTNIGSQTNISGPVNVRIGGEPRPPTSAELLAEGVNLLRCRQYVDACACFSKALQADPRNADAGFYLALATLQGQRPKLVSLAAVRKAESALQGVTQAHAGCGHALLLWAIVKYDAYVLNGMYERSPTIKELVGGVSTVGPAYLDAILAHMTATGNPLWERVRSMRQ